MLPLSFFNMYHLYMHLSTNKHLHIILVVSYLYMYFCARPATVAQVNFCHNVNALVVSHRAVVHDLLIDWCCLEYVISLKLSQV